MTIDGRDVPFTVEPGERIAQLKADHARAHVPTELVMDRNAALIQDRVDKDAEVERLTGLWAVDLGPIQVTTEKTRRIPLPPIVGTIALVGGIVLLIVNTQKP